MQNKIPQYDKSGMWKTFNEETGEEWGLVTTHWIFEDYAKNSLYYSFNIGAKHWHEHDFESVLKRCFDYPESFNLNEEDKELFTKRQIEFLDSLQKQCLKDNLKDIIQNDEYILEELEKRNYETLIENLKYEKDNH